MPDKLRKKIEARAEKLGFDVVRVVSADKAPDRLTELSKFVGEGRHGSMAWMEETLERRHHPKSLWPEVNSIIMLGLNYGPEENPLERLKDKGLGNISVYAQNRDYHDIIKGRLKELAAIIASDTGADVKVFVDTAPVMEKPLAEAAGIGWQGKHTNLVSRDFGSWLFLGAIFTTLEMAADRAEEDHCGSCRACLDICPTDAFPAPYQLDARRCISYLTIEHKGHIPRAFRKKIGNRIYGCDDCLAVCPWNKFAQASHEMKLKPRADLADIRLNALLKLDDAAFRALFSGSPVKRIGRDRFLRNALIAAGNSADESLLPLIHNLLDDTAAEVRLAAVWAYRQLAKPHDYSLEAERRKKIETDRDVLEEWLSPIS